MIAFIQIGNSDDKLSQAEWSKFVSDAVWIAKHSGELIGEWFSLPDCPWQNACWMIADLDEDECEGIAHSLAVLCKDYRQDSIALTLADHTRFIGAKRGGDE